MYMEQGNLIIREATMADTELLCNWWNDGEVMAHAGFPEGLGITEQEVLIQLQTGTDSERKGRLILKSMVLLQEK